MKRIIIFLVLTLGVFWTSCTSNSSDEPEQGNNGTNKTILELSIKDKENHPIEGAYVVVFRKDKNLHVRIGEGRSNELGYIKLADPSHSKGGYLTVAAPGYNSKKIETQIDIHTENKLDIILEEQNVIKILSYNIEEGFKNNQQLKTEFTSWIKIYDPDVLILQEMRHFTDVSFLEFAKSYGHNYATLLKTSGFPTAITSKEPIVNIKKVVLPDILHHGYLIGETYGITIFAIHLCPFEVDSPSNLRSINRKDEMAYILEQASKEPNSSILIAGDFNSHNEFDGESFGSGYPYENKDHTVTNMCKEYNYFDAYPLLNSSFKGSHPTKSISVNGTNKGYRIDYIMLNSTLKSACKYSDIIQNQFTDVTSDHYPIYIELLKEKP